MKVNFESGSFMSFLQDEILTLPVELAEQKREILKKSGKIMKNNVEQSLNRSTVNKPGYIHMKDDVKISVKDDGEGTASVTAYGGKKTGYKWHMLDDGTSNMQATHFTETALKNSESEIEGVVMSAMAKVTTNGK